MTSQNLHMDWNRASESLAFNVSTSSTWPHPTPTLTTCNITKKMKLFLGFSKRSFNMEMPMRNLINKTVHTVPVNLIVSFIKPTEKGASQLTAWCLVLSSQKHKLLCLLQFSRAHSQDVAPLTKLQGFIWTLTLPFSQCPPPEAMLTPWEV